MIYYRPVQSSRITQGFGENLNNYYRKAGLKGHNGVDFGVPNGTPIYWYGSGRGIVDSVGYDIEGGNYISVRTYEKGSIFLHRFFHLKSYVVSKGQSLETGSLMGYTNNTGKNTTGPHLHCLDIKEVAKNSVGYWDIINYENGYHGSIDPKPFFQNIFVLDVMNNLTQQVGLLKKVVDAIRKFLGK